MKAIGDGSSIAQVVVVVQNRIGKRRSHVTNLLSLCHQIQGAVLDELQHIGHSIRTMQIHIALFLAHESLVALGLEEFPCADEVLHHADVGTRLDVEVACIEETAHIQAWNQFVRLVFRIGGGSLTMQVEVVALWRLQIALLERLSVPSAIALRHIHVVHVDRHPHIGGGIRYLVIDMFVDEEVVGLRVAILDVIDTRLLHR